METDAETESNISSPPPSISEELRNALDCLLEDQYIEYDVSNCNNSTTVQEQLPQLEENEHFSEKEILDMEVIVVADEQINNVNIVKNNNIPEEDLKDQTPQPALKKTRKRIRNPHKWAENIRKENRQKGKVYQDRKGNERSAKKLLETCKTSCNYKCTEKISEEDRLNIFDEFWMLSDTKKNLYYSKHVSRNIVARRRSKQERYIKNYTYRYTFQVKDEIINVCRDYFLNTLNISKRRIYYFFEKMLNPVGSVPRSPLKGKNKKNVISDLSKNFVRDHINSFEPIESHYCRSNTNKKFLDSALNIRKMYNLYLEYLPATENPVKLSMYSNIFNTEFNLSFHILKKDLCDKCEEYSLLKDPSQDQVENYNEHILRKAEGRQERNSDRHLTDNNVAVITFDLQNVFSLPKCNVGKAFYKKKLCCYNLTGHCSKNGVTYCSLWHEYLAGRAGNHIASALVKILKQVLKDNPDIQKLILWSDSCVPQNKNSIMATALLHFLKSEQSKELQIIEQKFSEPGHGNLQEVDAVHSVIEKYLRNKEVKSPITLIRHLNNLPSHFKTKLRILQMLTNDFLNYQSVSNKLQYQTVPFKKVKHIVYTKDMNLNMKFRNDFNSENFQRANLLKSFRTNRTPSNNKQLNDDIKHIQELKEVNVGIDEDKRKHLISLMHLMDGVDYEFYKVLLKVDQREDGSNRTEQQTSKKSIDTGRIPQTNKRDRAEEEITATVKKLKRKKSIDLERRNVMTKQLLKQSGKTRKNTKARKKLSFE